MELDHGTYYGLSHSETYRTEEPKKHTKRNPMSTHLWSLCQFGGIQHGGICFEICLLSVACEPLTKGPGGAFVLQNEVSGRTSW